MTNEMTLHSGADLALELLTQCQYNRNSLVKHA